MAICEMQSSERSPSEIKPKVSVSLKQKRTWADEKRNLVKKRLITLSQKTKNEEAEENMDRTLIGFKGKTIENTDHRICAGVSTSAVDRDEKVWANLSLRFPSFSKLMLKSHIAGGFWLGLPKQFCDLHLPKYDETIVLVDENGQEYITKYLVHKNGLSGGWRGFSIAHELVEGDILVFELVEPHKFKVYIKRASCSTETQRAIGLQNLDVSSKQINSVSIFETDETTDDESDYFGAEIEEDIRFSESIPNFKDVKCFEDFRIRVDGGFILDSEIPQHMRVKYYRLCCSQNMFLHDRLVEGLNIDLIIGMILETITIADGIRAVESTTSLHHLQSWDRTLKAFEDLGMAVGFLRARVHKLLDIVRESQAVIESKKKERAEAEKEMREAEERFLKMKGLMRGLNEEIESLLKVKNEKIGSLFKEIASVSW